MKIKHLSKIICTLGPASNEKDIISNLINEGMTIARLNMSHGSHEYHQNLIDNINIVCKEKNKICSILLDTKGPEIRLGLLKEPYKLLKGDRIFLYYGQFNELLKNKKCVEMSYNIIDSIKLKEKIMIDDGKISLTIENINDNIIECISDESCIIESRKSINLPGRNIDIPFMNQKDKEDIIFGIKNNISFIAASFTRNVNDIYELRNFLKIIMVLIL